MKSIFLLVLGISGMVVVTAQNVEKPFRLKGTVSGMKEPVARVYLTYALNGERKLDTAIIKNGGYEFSGQLSEPTLARIRAIYPEIDGKNTPINAKKDIAVVFLQPGNITITHTDSFSHSIVKGSASHDAYLSLDTRLKSLNDKMQELSLAYAALYRNKDEEGMKKMEPQFDEIQASIKKEYLGYAKGNPESPIAVYVVNQYAGWEINPDEVEPVFNSLPASMRNQPTAKLLQEKIELAKKTAVGRFAMDFTQADTLGNPISLSSLRGKYVLVDFWASWCGPCRAENPNVVNAYNKFKGKGFHIMGVSLDQPNAKDKWLKAIHDDNLTWTHVSDLQYWKNAVAIQYGIQSIPANLLIDPTGKIIAKNLRGDELQKKLEALLDKP
ncbi:MAG TPA: TlpA disulfide reductase family protein [Flavitalea sp.]|nr:TlpA disulfide reductase family protein [Flavitalea sp.]